jgi:hypothetical protein
MSRSQGSRRPGSCAQRSAPSHAHSLDATTVARPEGVPLPLRSPGPNACLFLSRARARTRGKLDSEADVSHPHQHDDRVGAWSCGVVPNACLPPSRARETVTRPEGTHPPRDDRDRGAWAAAGRSRWARLITRAHARARARLGSVTKDFTLYSFVITLGLRGPSPRTIRRRCSWCRVAKRSPPTARRR